MITTAGTVRECIFDDMYEYACRVADGEEVDEAFLPILYELDERSEWLDPKMWIKANPGLGKIKQVETLRSFVERAKKTLLTEQAFSARTLTHERTAVRRGCLST